MQIKSFKLTYEEIDLPIQIIKLEASIFLYIGTGALNFENLILSLRNSRYLIKF